MKDTVMVFVRPNQQPRMAVAPAEDVRIAYRDVWIDFRDGNIVVRHERGAVIFSGPATGDAYPSIKAETGSE